MGFFYSFLKLKKAKNKVTFISRQGNAVPKDFELIAGQLEKNYPQYEIKMLCKVIPGSFFGKVGYVFHMFSQMNAMATSKVLVLDGYCILASMLRHKNELKIIQLWHALGAFKRFGKSILDMPGGSSTETARAFKMHNNYDYIAASGVKCVPHFAEAFGQRAEKFLPIGLPRMDFLADPVYKTGAQQSVFKAYPQLDNGKKTIFYAPTFRDNENATQSLRAAENELICNIDYSRFNLVIKRHPVDLADETVCTSGGCVQGNAASSAQFMAASSAVITDYSSVIYEALLLEKPVYIFCFDGEDYIDERGFYIDFYNDIPAVFAKNAAVLAQKIAAGERCGKEKIQQFKKDYVNKKYPCISFVYAEIIDELIRGVYDGRYNYRGEWL